MEKVVYLVFISFKGYIINNSLVVVVESGESLIIVLVLVMLLYNGQI